MKSIKKKKNHKLLLGLAIAVLFLVGMAGMLYVVYKPASTEMGSKASYTDSDPDWGSIHPWKRVANTSSLPGSGNFQSLSEYVFGDSLFRSFVREGRWYSQRVGRTNGVVDWSTAQPWRERSDMSEVPGSGEIQSLTELMYPGHLVQTLIRGGKMYVKRIPYTGGSIEWQPYQSWKEVSDISSLPGQGEFQSLSEYFTSVDLVRHLIRGDELFVQQVPVYDGVPQWSADLTWRQTPTTELATLPGSGTIQHLHERIDGNFLNRTFLRNNEMYTQVVPLNNQSRPEWSVRHPWKKISDLSSLPGATPSYEALSEYTTSSQLVRTLFRGDEMYTQKVMLNSGVPDWSKAEAWAKVANTSSLPGLGTVEVFSEYSTQKNLYRTIVRSGHLFSQRVPLVNSLPDWKSVTPWKETADLSSLPGEGTIQSLSEYITVGNLTRTLFRSGTMYSQRVPLANGEPNWTMSGGWTEINDMSTFPTGGDMQVMSEYISGGYLRRTLIRGGIMYSQQVPLAK